MTHIKKKAVLIAVLGVLFSIGSANANTVLVSESFGGVVDDPLNGTSADTFSADIVIAGGSVTWVAAPEFRENGQAGGGPGNIYAGTTLSHAHLDLGTYLNDHKGEADGIFELTATLTHTSGDAALATLTHGFRLGNTTPDLEQHFLFSGVASWWQRGGGTNSEMIAGPGNGNRFNGNDVSGFGTPVTVTITLDLSDHDGISEFGTVSYESTDFPVDSINNGNSSLPFAYTADYDFRYLMISESRQQGGFFDDLSLVQLPAPIPGDFNGDDFVDLADYTVWRNNLGADRSVLPSGSASSTSGPIDSTDYQLWKDSFGADYGNLSGIATAVVPEPSTLAMLAGAMAIGLLRLRQRKA